MPGIAGLLGLGLAAILALNLLPALAQSLAREFVDNIAPVTAYENCRAIRKDYPDGVGTAAAVEGLDRTRRLPETSDRVYEANASLDKDDDGLVCERKNGP